MRMRTTLIVLLVNACAATAVSAQSPTPSAPSGVAQDTIKTIAAAVAKADLSALEQLRQQSSDSTTQLLVSMAEERIHADFDKSNADATLCEQKLFDSDTETALFCARFRVGNLRLAGKDQASNQADLDMVKHFQSKLPSGQAQRYQAYADTNDHLPVLTVQRPSQGFSIPLLYGDRRRRDGNLAQSSKRDIDVVANGHAVTVRVNTSVDYIDMDEDTAQQLGVHLTDVHANVRTTSGDKVPAHVGVLDKLVFNGVTVENAPVLILPHMPPSLGIGVLKYLGTFRITKDAIEVSGTNDQPLATHDPMLIASHIDGFNMRLVAPLTINGVSHLALLNTGDPYYLTGSKAALSDVDTRFMGQIQKRDAADVRHGEIVDRTMATVVMGGQPMQMKFGVFADENLPWSYQLGRSALQDMDFYFDFQNGHAALIPRSDLR